MKALVNCVNHSLKSVVFGLVLFSFLSNLPIAHAVNTPYISVGTAKTKKTVVAFPDIRYEGDSTSAKYAKIIHETVTRDLAFMDLFRFLSPAAFVEDVSRSGILPESFKLSDWTSIGAEFLVKSKISARGRNLALEAHIYDTFGAKQILSKKLISSENELKTTGHLLANAIVEALTGLPGIFQTKIAMSCDRSGKKEIYMMDFDGTNVKQITNHKSIAFAPAWSPDGTKLAYSLFTRHRNNVKNIDLYEFDFNSSTYRMLSNRKGMNSGAAYTPDGKKIAVTMSFLGNPEIFTLDPTTHMVTPIVKSFGFDVDPAWSPDGRSLAFVSSRAGPAMVYSTQLDTGKTERLTYAGKYNATPSWSPQNNKIAFAGWIDRHFDIFIINPDGTNIQRLTQNMGNNEDPFFSADGNFIAFSSNRTGQKNIYVMNMDGTFVKRLTFGLGNCVSPKWSYTAK